MLVFQTGLFFDDCNAWRQKPDADKTWQNFKTHFTEAYRQHRLQTTTMQASSYHTANHVSHTETAEALANLATATAAKKRPKKDTDYPRVT